MKKSILVLIVVCMCSCSSKQTVINDFVASRVKAENQLFVLADKVQSNAILELLENSYPEAKVMLTRNIGGSFEYTINREELSDKISQGTSQKWEINDFSGLNVSIWENDVLWSKSTIVELIHLGEKNVYRLSEPVLLGKNMTVFYLVIDKFPTAETKKRCLIVMKNK